MKKILTLTLAVIMLLAAFSTLTVGATEDKIPVSYYSGKADTSWYDAKNVKTEYHITSADQLAGLSEIVADGQKFAGVTFYLDCDIVWNDGKLTMDENGMPIYKGKPVSETNKPLDYTPIGQYPEPHTSNDPGLGGNYFFGNFDGHGHVISGLYVNEPTKIAVGLFSIFAGDYMKDLSIVNSYFGSFARSGSFAGFVYTIKEKGSNNTVGTRISGLYSDANVVAFNESDGQNGRIGGIVGLMVTANYGGAKAKSNGCIEIIENCWFAGAIQHIKGTRYSGGILGVAAAGNTSNKVEVYMNNCLMTGSIYMGLDYAEALRVGGILGNIWQGTVTLKNCVSVISDTNVLKNNYFNSTNEGKSLFVGCQEGQPAHVIHENCFYTPIGRFDHCAPAVHSGGAQSTVTGTPTNFEGDISKLSTLMGVNGASFDFTGDTLSVKGLRTAIVGITDSYPDTVPEEEKPTVTTTAKPDVTTAKPEGGDTAAAPVTETPATTAGERAKGCGGFSAAGALALIAILASTVVIKKKN